MGTETRTCRISLLGCWRLHDGEQPVSVGSREERVTALLALRGPQTRIAIAGTLWPDSTESRARANLRTSLQRLRGIGGGLVATTRTALALSSNVTVDVWDLADCLDHVERGRDVSAAQAPEVLAALEGPDLLPGWYDDWVLFERERLHHRRIRALDKLGRDLLDGGQVTLAVRVAEEALALEPLLESSATLLVRAHLASGNHSAAVSEFDRYRQRLVKELGITPGRTLTELMSGYPRATITSRILRNAAPASHSH